ncbi:F-box/kelch-repeat protein [Senna tora]|uniref:F-box/kelch-repeat protein n=1 Tax=Senna tora TaxID=362788 RepID=A0A834U2H0_9FABA|nr:F-box/kelch-repeat protein [Senna tora]
MPKSNRKSDLPSKHCPWLVYCNDRKQIFCSLSQPHKIYRKKIPALFGDSLIVAHSSGWFLLSDQEDTLFSLWNPTISNSSLIHLPPLSFNPTPKIKHYLLSSPPGDPDCKVLLFDNGSITLIRPQAPHNKEWTQIEYAKSSKGCLEKCVSCKGKLYGYTSYKGHHHQLVTFNVDKGNNNNLDIEFLCCMPEMRTLSTVGTLWVECFKWLIECCGELLFVYVVLDGSKTISEVNAFKLDFEKMIWRRAENLMGQAVFLDAVGASSFDPAFEKGLEGDSIYFTDLDYKGLLYSFNVTNGCLSVTLPRPNLPSPWSSPMIFVPPHVWLSRDSTLPTGREEQGEIFGEKEDKSTAEIVQVQETSFLDIPLDSLVIIADCLNLFGYLNFRATCRDFRLIPKLQHTQALQRFKTCYSSSPPPPMWLLLSVNDRTAFKFVDPIHGTSFLMSVPESLKGNVVCYSKNGWLLMSDGKSSMSFLNPFTEEIIKLPTLRIKHSASSYAMSFSSLPTSPDCIVVGFVGISTTAAKSELEIIATIMEEDYEWSVYSVHQNSKSWSNNRSSPLFYKRAFTLLNLEGRLSFCRYEPEDDDFEEDLSWDMPEILKVPCSSFHQNFLLECDGKLMSIFVGEMGKWLQVYSLHYAPIRWEKVESIGNYVIYVSRSSSVAIEARIMGTNNRIYFPRFRDNNILYYSLETKKFHLDGQGTVKNFYNTKEPLLATWIQPVCS